MLSFLPAPARGSLAFLGIVLNTVFWCLLLFPAAFIKLIVPIPGFRRFMNKVLDGIATNWISCNNLNLALINKIAWDAQGL